MSKTIEHVQSMAEMRKMQQKIAKEKFDEINDLCMTKPIDCRMEETTIHLKTDAGAWKFDAAQEKVHLFHKNYKFRQSTMGNYHRQWVKAVSMRELIEYICSHDHIKKFMW